MITREKGECGKVGKGKGGINGEGRRLDLWYEHTIQYADGVLQNCMPETCIKKKD